MRLRTTVVWLSRTWPIKRRWRLYWGERLLLSLPLRTVEWSRHEPDPAEALGAHDWDERDWDKLERVDDA